MMLDWKFQDGLQSRKDYLTELDRLSKREYELNLAAAEAELALAKDGPAKAAAEARIQAIRDREALRSGAAQRDQDQEDQRLNGTAGQGFGQGVLDAVAGFGTVFETFKQLGLDAIGSVVDAMSQGMTQMILHGGSMGQALKGIWTSLTQTVVQSLTKMLSQMLINWAIEKAIAAWKWLVAAQQSATEKKSMAEKLASDNVKRSSDAATAGQGFFAGFASTPWIGFALAVAAIVAMQAFMGSMTAHAKGGVIDKPTLALMGEVPGSTEIVANERDFKSWANTLQGGAFNLGQNIAIRQQQAQSYDLQSADFASSAHRTASTEDRTPSYVDMRGAIIANHDDPRLQELIYKSHQGYQRANG
jgi:hypothetical protein